MLVRLTWNPASAPVLCYMFVEGSCKLEWTQAVQEWSSLDGTSQHFSFLIWMQNGYHGRTNNNIGSKGENVFKKQFCVKLRYNFTGNYLLYHFFLFNDAESLVWTHHDIAEILLKYLNINTTQSINVVVDILVNFVNSSMRKLKTMIMVSKNRIVLWIPALEYFPIFFM